MIDGNKWSTNCCEHIDWKENHNLNLAKRIEGEQPIAHRGHDTSDEEIFITIF
jgi:hypothetical protein